MQFESAAKAANAITELQTQYQLSDGSISENTGVMGNGWGKTNNTAMQSMYGLAAILFVLVLLAGILMISGSMNSIIAQNELNFLNVALHWCKSSTNYPLCPFGGIELV